ncbi:MULTISPECIES: hypothetical protein [unclassified Roseofilum]|uniref:hypothetical protein n=1 Tax=unclassified Roseofilum TaxID=2620099 RepID=UPI000E8B6709|nr:MULTISPECIES: hypothetical protein [unclassified Roseofilum]MBP0026231.1 hypothetical protein [Roseofilum sp. SID2]HBQ97779.1 hypothetical protein [Cyanobacteria bacterium UBA11691]MBP0009088.1 hypothetical protein [Roseofilum sp. Belize Diploria]MBP0013779.1 hypothetical protein [Roseofilum sp. SID3]MBP0040595.1 hypothetical protein [Roseofilum sp. SBFL]
MNVSFVLLTFSTLMAAVFNPLVSDRVLSNQSKMSLLEQLEQDQVQCNVFVVEGDRLQRVCQLR